MNPFPAELMVKPEDLDPSQLPRERMIALATSLDTALTQYTADHEALAAFLNMWTVAGLAAKRTGRDQYELPFVAANALMMLKASQLLPSIAQMIRYGASPRDLLSEMLLTKEALGCDASTAPSVAVKNVMDTLEKLTDVAERRRRELEKIHEVLARWWKPNITAAAAVANVVEYVNQLEAERDDLVANQGRVAKVFHSIAAVLGPHRQPGKMELVDAVKALVKYAGELEARVTELSEDADDTDLAEEFYDDEGDDHQEVIVGEHVVPGEPSPRPVIERYEPGGLLKTIGAVVPPTPLRGADLMLTRFADGPIGPLTVARAVADRNPGRHVIVGQADFVTGSDGVTRVVRQVEARVYRTIQGGHGGPLPQIVSYERVDQVDAERAQSERF